VVGVTGFIHGEINCKNADISGKTDGRILVSELLALKSTAKVKGEINVAKLSIEPNAIFTGNCNMSSDVSRQSQDRPPVIITNNEKAIK
jgi:cytoskeletal protein CcmA (bactofilin family)